MREPLEHKALLHIANSIGLEVFRKWKDEARTKARRERVRFNQHYTLEHYENNYVINRFFQEYEKSNRGIK